MARVICISSLVNLFFHHQNSKQFLFEDEGKKIKSISIVLQFFASLPWIVCIFSWFGIFFNSVKLFYSINKSKSKRKDRKGVFSTCLSSQLLYNIFINIIIPVIIDFDFFFLLSFGFMGFLGKLHISGCWTVCIFYLIMFHVPLKIIIFQSR